MNRNQILKIYGTDYKEMTKRLLASAELDRHLLWAASQKAGKGFSSGDRAAGAVSGAEEDGSLVSAEDKKALRIAIKPNLVCATPASFGGTTHPEIVAGIIEYRLLGRRQNIGRFRILRLPRAYRTLPCPFH